MESPHGTGVERKNYLYTFGQLYRMYAMVVNTKWRTDTVWVKGRFVVA